MAPSSLSHVTVCPRIPRVPDYDSRIADNDASGELCMTSLWLDRDLSVANDPFPDDDTFEDLVVGGRLRPV